MRRHLVALAILGWLLTWTVKNPDSTLFADYEAAWPLEVTTYFIGLNGWETDADGNLSPLYSARTPVRYYVWPRAGCGPMGANACLWIPVDPGPGDVWMVEETPEWCCRKLDGAP